MKAQKIIFSLMAIVVICLVFWFGFFSTKNTKEQLPENIKYINSSKDLILVDTPQPSAVVGKEFSILGRARGTWYFEASFPIVVLDDQGDLLANGVAQAQGDWMTPNFVEFKADIKVPETYIGGVTIVLKKDNPSGDPARDASISFPVSIEY